MNIIYLLMPLALGLGAGFLIAFLKASRDGQFDDLETPRHRIFIEKE
jgi:cbb3-type cytochrome oxidase maturation protein